MQKIAIAVWLLCAAGQSQAQALGRLFLTPPERAQLDRQRASGRADAPVSGAPALAEVAAPPPPVIVIDGVLTRSRSPRTVAWVDGVPQEGSLKGGKLTVNSREAAAGVSLRLPSGARVTVKPGQQVDTATGQVREGDAPASVRRAGAEPGVGQHD